MRAVISLIFIFGMFFLACSKKTEKDSRSNLTSPNLIEVPVATSSVSSLATSAVAEKIKIKGLPAVSGILNATKTTQPVNAVNALIPLLLMD